MVSRLRTTRTDPWGIDPTYVDAAGGTHRVPERTIAALRERIGAPPHEDPAAPVVARRGDAVPGGAATLRLEDGTETAVRGTFPPDLPFGYHVLLPEGGADPGGARRLILGPGRCHTPPARAWGWAVQLYATRSAASWGMGDLGDLATLTRWSARELGTGFVLLNPLGATAPTCPQQPSPYFPASRRFRNPIYLRVEDVPGADRAAAEVGSAARAGRALNSRREIDRDAVWRAKLAALEAIWAATAGGSEFTAWRDAQGTPLAEFATWSALAERHDGGWRDWPEEFADPRGPAVLDFAARHADRVAFFAWLQWLLDRQLAAAAAGLAVIEDLPIGVDPAGADAWVWQEQFAAGVTVGAPPDEFNTHGQDWGLPPFIPWRLRAAGYQPFIDTVRAAMATGGGLRIDHVMGLFRLWWIPEGADPADGAYVRYPAADLLEILALESHRSGAVVVGEDLGTVEPGVREAMAERGVLSYRLLWFEDDDPAVWPAEAMAAVTTHDLPTVAGLWDGSDLQTQADLGLDPNVEATLAIRDRLATAAGLPPDAPVDEVVPAAHALLARAPASLLTATLDDAVGETERPNIPGGDGKRPNWCLALPVPLDDLPDHPLARRIADTLTAAVTGPPAQP